MVNDLRDARVLVAKSADFDSVEEHKRAVKALDHVIELMENMVPTYKEAEENDPMIFDDEGTPN